MGEDMDKNDEKEGSDEEAEEKPEEEKEDPEITWAKEEMASLDKEVTAKKREISSQKDKVVEAGKTGYLRLAANVENYKRRIKESKKDNEGAAMLAVTKAFFGTKDDDEASVMEMFRDGLTALPVSDGEEKEAESKLHESYQALYRDMLDKFTKFGLQEYHAVVGENYDASVHEKTGEIEVGGAETENDLIPGTITEEMASGLKMPHGVVRRAKVVVAVAAPSTAESEDETEAKEGKDEASATTEKKKRKKKEEEEEATETEEENDSTSDEVAE